MQHICFICFVKEPWNEEEDKHIKKDPSDMREVDKHTILYNI